MLCPDCGTELPDTALFCLQCGANVPRESEKVLADEVREAATEDASDILTDAEILEGPPEISIDEFVPPEMPEPAKQKNRVFLLSMIALVVIVLGVAAVFFVRSGNRAKLNAQFHAYDRAEELIADERIDEAIAVFRALGTFSDSAQRVQELSELQNAYNAAFDLLAAREYDVAADAFAQIKDFRDCREMASKGVDYAQALDIYADAETAEDYIRAAQLLDGLSGYKSADDYYGECCLQAALLCLESGEFSKADEYASLLDQRRIKEYEEAVSQMNVDLFALDALKTALQMNYDMMAGESDMSYSEHLDESIKLLEKYETVLFSDTRIQELYLSYLEGLYDVRSVVDIDGYITDYGPWYDGYIRMCSAAETLHAEYSLFSGNRTLRDYYLNSTRYYEACGSIEAVLERDLWDAQEQYDEAGDYYYLVIYNDSGYRFNVDITISFSLGEEYLDTTFTDTYTVEVGQTVKIPAPFTEEEFDTWYIDWYFHHIYNSSGVVID